ncbi:hypothetical protein RYA95_27750, partial [Pseudomonas syringae pv. actinidiae]|nr:hypothetical protein B1R35_27560 [Pseudomonas syringae pv. actinidiae]AQX67316.1 hypothetical protein B1F85_27600 [Pseudomonas syringae pv. actinidiae]MDU8616794.1 hypothetical protein [Pseudomonas syringae pv. actinidiae]NAS79817.1 hypothetical protein [Pseudomonas syringae pv. actinidiae]NAT03759.1 hypothetical protein [Pseudomonas syringae pv. actinidiae]
MAGKEQGSHGASLVRSGFGDDLDEARSILSYTLVYRLKINFSHACVLIATRARWILFKISSPLAFQT